MSEEKDLLILDKNTLEKQKELRYKELENRGIPEPERTRAVEAEFVDYPTPTDIIPWPGPVTGVDLAGNINLDLILASKEPPIIQPNTDYTQPFPTPDRSPYGIGTTSQPYPSSPTPDIYPPLGSVSHSYDIKNPAAASSTNWVGTASDVNSEPSMHNEHGFNVTKSIPEWRYPIEDSQIDFGINIPPIIIEPSGQFNETEWEEGAHPRDEDGKFTDKGGVSTSSRMDMKASKDDLKGFEGNKKIKLGRNVPLGSLDEIKEIWNNLSIDARNLVDNIMVRSSKARGSITVGEWIADSNTMEITAHPAFTKKDYEETMHHEIGHAKFKTFSPEKIQAWNNAVEKIRPPTKYANLHRERYFNYRRTVRFRPEDRSIVERNVEALKNLYYEEIHSETYANLKSPLNEKKIYSKEGLKDATKIYKEIFE